MPGNKARSSVVIKADQNLSDAPLREVATGRIPGPENRKKGGGALTYFL
jgi:hypothetical protein